MKLAAVLLVCRQIQLNKMQRQDIMGSKQRLRALLLLRYPLLQVLKVQASNQVHLKSAAVVLHIEK